MERKTEEKPFERGFCPLIVAFFCIGLALRLPTLYSTDMTKFIIVLIVLIVEVFGIATVIKAAINKFGNKNK